MAKTERSIPIPLWILFFAVLVNVGQFYIIDRYTPKNYRALYGYENSNLTDISLEESGARGHWFHAITLSNIALDSTVYIPEDSYFNNDKEFARLYVYGEAKKVEAVNLKSSEVLSGFDPSEHVVASGEYYVSSDPYFAIAMGQNEENKDKALVPDTIEGLSVYKHLQQRKDVKFAYVEWSGPDKPFHPTRQVTKHEFPFYALFIEVDLLPEDVRLRFPR